MLKIEKFVTPSPEQWEIIIEGMRNPKNSWDRMDSHIFNSVLKNNAIAPGVDSMVYEPCEPYISIGEKDHTLMDQLNDGGPVHAKYRRMIPVWVTLTAPLYWYKELDTYKVGTVSNSCSTMHKIHAKEFTLEDFSMEHLLIPALDQLKETIEVLNRSRDLYLGFDGFKEEYGDFDKGYYWWQMIQLLPSSYNQKRTIMLNYEVLHNIYIWRKNHKLTEWHTFCDWIRELPYSELITCEEDENG